MRENEPRSSGACEINPGAMHGAPKRRFKRALVVDDERSLQLLVRAVLEPRQFVVDTALDAVEACECVRHQAYDAILCDVIMPRMSGPEFFAALREIDQSQASRVIFITGYELDPETKCTVRETGRPLLRKPFGVDELEQAVRAVSL